MEIEHKRRVLPTSGEGGGWHQWIRHYKVWKSYLKGEGGWFLLCKRPICKCQGPETHSCRSRKTIHHLLVEVSSHWTLAYSSIARCFNQIVFPAILFSARFSFWHSLIIHHCRRNYGTLISCHILVFHSFLNHGGCEIKFLYNCNYHLPDRLTCPSFHFFSCSLWVIVLSCLVTGLIKLFFPFLITFVLLILWIFSIQYIPLCWLYMYHTHRYCVWAFVSDECMNSENRRLPFHAVNSIYIS